METPLLSSPGRISVHHLRGNRREPCGDEEVAHSDAYRLSLPLRPAKISIVSNAKLLYEGSVCPGMMRLTSPEERVDSTWYTPWDLVCLYISKPMLGSMMRATGVNYQPGEITHLNPLLRPSSHVEQISQLLLHTREFDPVHAQLYVDGLTTSLLASLLWHHHFGAQEGTAKRGLTMTQMQKAAEFADARMGGPLSLESWAGVLDMSASGFARRFRATTGCSPYGWFMGRRINHAKQLLRETAWPLYDVAFRVGFANQSHFTEAFRRRVGVPPSRWRQEHRLTGSASVRDRSDANQVVRGRDAMRGAVRFR